GFLNARGSLRADVQTKLAGVDIWKKILSEEWQQQQRRHAATEENQHEAPAQPQRGFQPARVALAETIEASLESLLKSREEISSAVLAGSIMLVAAQDVHDQGRHERP